MHVRIALSMQFCTIFYFRRKKPPEAGGWRVHAKMSCNAMQMSIEWRMDKIQDAIQSLRRTLSQSEIARRTGIAQHKISRWEAGGIPAGASDALKLIKLAAEIDAPTPARGEAQEAALICRVAGVNPMASEGERK